LFSLIDDPELLELAISEADRIVKGFDRPQSGILFTLPIGQVLGLNKWGQERQASETEDSEIPPEEDRVKSNLLGWLQDDIEARYGEGVLKDWSTQRGKPVSEIMRQPAQKPVFVRMDNTLQTVLQGFLGDPEARFACVVNSEERLMGIIESQQLANVMFMPVMPEEYIDDPQGYEMVLQHADIEQMPVAADIMSDPVFVQPDDTVAKTYQLLKEHHLAGLPVVDKNYRVEGYITLLELMAACFGEEEE
jgi:CBS domain-containing protein